MAAQSWTAAAVRWLRWAIADLSDLADFSESTRVTRPAVEMSPPGQGVKLVHS